MAFKLPVQPHGFHHDHYLLFLLKSLLFSTFQLWLWLFLLSSSVPLFPRVSSGPFSLDSPIHTIYEQHLCLGWVNLSLVELSPVISIARTH